jgi:hypothetical protein
MNRPTTDVWIALPTSSNGSHSVEGSKKRRKGRRRERQREGEGRERE